LSSLPECLVACTLLFKKKDTDKDFLYSFSLLFCLFVNSLKFAMQAVYLLTSEISSLVGLVSISQIHLLVFLHALSSLSL
jgi:hypothetical protein